VPIRVIGDRFHVNAIDLDAFWCIEVRIERQRPKPA
jgi:hypothetical protein